MARKYKRDSSGRFAGGGGGVKATRMNKALAKVGVKTKKYKVAERRAKAAQKKVDDRRIRRRIQSREKQLGRT